MTAAPVENVPVAGEAPEITQTISVEGTSRALHLTHIYRQASVFWTAYWPNVLSVALRGPKDCTILDWSAPANMRQYRPRLLSSIWSKSTLQLLGGAPMVARSVSTRNPDQILACVDAYFPRIQHDCFYLHCVADHRLLPSRLLPCQEMQVSGAEAGPRGLSVSDPIVGDVASDIYAHTMLPSKDIRASAKSGRLSKPCTYPAMMAVRSHNWGFAESISTTG